MSGIDRFAVTASITGSLRIISVSRGRVVIESPDGSRDTLRAGDTLKLTLQANADYKP